MIILNLINNPKKLDVIISNGWNRVGYNIIRSLGRKRLQVGLCDSEFLGMSVFSRYTTTFLYHPSYYTNPLGFIKRLKEALLKYDPSVYIPSDEEIFVIAKYRDYFKDLPVMIPIAPFNTLKTLHKKNEISRLAQSLGIPVPETLYPKDEKEILAFAHEYGNPIVLKILSSSGARGIFYLTNDHLLTILAKIMKTHNIQFGDFIIQQYIKGTGYGVSLLFNNGQLRAKFTHKRLREKLYTGGTSTLRMSIENPIIEEYAEKLLEHVNYHGVAMVEFKYDEKMEKGWLIEVNPRFWGSLALAIQSGVDFPYLLYKMALEGDVSSVLTYRKGVKVKWILGDLFGVVEQIKAQHQFSLRDVFTGADGYDDFYWDDPLPTGAEFLFYFLKLIKNKLPNAKEKGDINLEAI